MAKFELKIYGEDDEVVKTYGTDRIRWGVFLNAIKLQDKIKDKSEAEQFSAINEFIKSIFIGLTDKELEQADGMDVMNVFKQILSAANGIDSSKNV